MNISVEAENVENLLNLICNIFDKLFNLKSHSYAFLLYTRILQPISCVDHK